MGSSGRVWQERVAGGVLRAAVGLPGPVRRLVAGRPISVDGQELHPELQLALRLMGLAPEAAEKSLLQRRAELDQQARIFGGTQLPIDVVEQVFIPGAAGKIPARLYRPAGCESLLVYYHGGGFVVGGLDSTDSLCRFLAVHSDTAVLSVDYRLAPESPFPAAVDDAVTAFHYAVSHATELGAEPTAIGVGGDSAGGNLAAVVAQMTTAQGGTAPAFQMLFYPWLDLSTKHPSYKLFGEGFMLTESQLDWYSERYLPEQADATNPRVSPLLATDLTGQPPTYIAVAGFDPLRDEGERYADRLREAGVPVTLRRHSGLIHAFASGTGVGTACRDAMVEAAAALRMLKESDTGR